MSEYRPPFTISPRMLALVAAISEKVGGLSSVGKLATRPHLRRNNRIKSIHASLRIEANSLSLGAVRDVLNGHLVLGDRKEIQEVKDAYAAYEALAETDPFSLEELKRLHGLMTGGTVADAGEFRRSAEGVFKDGTCIFLAPPAHMVNGLMNDLFAWMKENDGVIHPLIISSVFHYEFVYIHPFSDGNGRMARLWHTALLSRWRSLFSYIPLESQIEKYQSGYYEAIEECHNNGNSNAFIEFMLQMIDETLDAAIEETRRSLDVSEYVRLLLEAMEYDVPYTSSSIMENLGLKSKETFRKNYLDPAMELGLVRMTIPDKPNSRNQRYVKD